jgi:hypothetical protein
MKATKTLTQDSRSPDQDLKPVPHEYEAGVLTTQPRCSVQCKFADASQVLRMRAQLFRASIIMEVATHFKIKPVEHLTRASKLAWCKRGFRATVKRRTRLTDPGAEEMNLELCAGGGHFEHL